MEKNKKPKYDRRLFFAVVLLTLFGYIMVISAHARVWVEHGFDVFAFEIFKTTAFIVAGFILMIIVRNRYSLTGIMKRMNVLIIIATILMVSTLFFPEVYGAQRWIRLPGITIQPVEFVKLLYILFFSYHFGRFYNKKVKAGTVLRLPLLIIGITILFVFLLQGDLGSTLILMMMTLCIFLAVPEKKYNKYKVVISLFMIVSIALFYIFGPSISEMIYSLPDDSSAKVRLLRIAVLFNPLEDVFNTGYQVTNSLVALVHGGLFGSGIGNSTTKFILPEPYNDAIIAVIAEELGLIGLAFLFVLYFYIISRLLNYAKLSKINIYDRLILIGIASFFAAQFFANVGGMVGAIPMTGVTLLFVSSGGSSILSAFIAIGIAQGVIKKYIK